MYTLEDVQFKWALGGGLLAIPALGLLAGAIAFTIHMRRQREEERFFREYTSPDKK